MEIKFQSVLCRTLQFSTDANAVAVASSLQLSHAHSPQYVLLTTVRTAALGDKSDTAQPMQKLLIIIIINYFLLFLSSMVFN